MTTKRECIHLSLGSTANAVSAHLLNLQGLAVTSGNCEPIITHAVEHQTLVPRVLIVDEPSRLRRRGVSSPTTEVSTWNGQVQVNQMGQQEVDKNEWLEQLHRAATSLVMSPFSRYHIESSTLPTYFTSDNGRHVIWGDDEEEEEEQDEDEETEEERRMRLQRERGAFILNQRSVEEQMTESWRQQKDKTDDVPSEQEEAQQESSLSWMDYWMPPHPLKYDVPLPFHQSDLVETWDSFVMGSRSISSDWQENELLEGVRHILEDCDSTQGVTIATEGCGVYAGLTALLLEELREECRTAGRFVLHVTDPPEASTEESEKETAWHPAHVRRVRRTMQSGLALQNFGMNANIVLPLCVDAKVEQDVFRKSSILSLALEAATLAYRVNDSAASLVGLTGYYGGSGMSRGGYGTTSSLSFGEYLAALQPSQQYKFVELEASVDKMDISWLEKGTSVEQERLMRMGGQQGHGARRGRDELPGGWLDTAELLRNLSPAGSSKRSMHYQFATTASLRPCESYGSSDPLACLMESIGIRYRPEVSMGVVLRESFSELTTGSYGAGSYWKVLHPMHHPCVLSVLSNSSRSYGYLHGIAAGIKESLSFKFRGYHNRDVMSGLLPEAEDCEEAKEYCYEVREMYHPPEGSGLVVDEEGTYFDDGV